MSFSHLLTLFKAVHQLGFTQVTLNVLYRLGLRTGYYRYLVDIRKPNIELSNIAPLFSIPSREDILQTLGVDGLQALLAEADEIVAGKFRQFGAEPVEIDLAPPPPLAHWTVHARKKEGVYGVLSLATSDIKFIWEPARFGWAFVLGRAWHASGDEKYAAAFWRHFETFQAANPPYLGPNWTSGQEVGIRLMAFVWAAQVFANAAASTQQRSQLLTEAVAQHVLRIPPTLLYARSQNNNHLLTEAAALYTASLALPDHPHAPKWKALGQNWLAWCFTHQINDYGEYVQHSTNYHRLMLQTALWIRMLENSQNQSTVDGPRSIVSEKLSLAAHWLLSLLDPDSGHVPNLGANDGALIFRFSVQPFADVRPVAQAAARAFLGANMPPGPWDEMSLWFGLPLVAGGSEFIRYPGDHIYAPHSWGYLRAVKFKSRPSHADQLHFDLWWRGLNIAQDAGTYLYNVPTPWDNRLTSTLVHNTVSVDGREQMTRAGRFLYLDWADATSKRHFETRAGFSQRASAQTDAYALLGIRNERTVTVFDDERWLVEDELFNPERQPHTFRLHWLLPDWEYEIESSEERIVIRLQSPHGWVALNIQTIKYRVSLVRAGEYLHGSGAADPIRGWVSPTYAQKIPALSLAVEVEAAEDVRFTSEFRFPTVDGGR